MRKLLVSAYGCEPNKGSEQGVGWHWVLEMAKTEELWVITRSNNRQGIESGLPPEFAGRAHFIYYDLPERLRWFKRKEKGLYLYYALWQWGAYRRAKQLANEIRFDYCLHLTFGSMWMPTFMYKLPIPFIWGPVGGGESVPFRFIRTLPLRGRITQYARRMLIRGAALNPLFASPARAARAIIARTDDSKAAFPLKYRHKVRVMLETGMSEDVLQRYQASVTRSSDTNLHLVYVGRLVAIKNVATAIRAFASLPNGYAHLCLTIVGDGPLLDELKELAQQLGVIDRVCFVGTVSQEEAIRTLRLSHICLFPSLKEGGTWSLMEAMAVGLPVICLDTSGMHIITDESCAIRIPVTTPAEATLKMSEAIKLLADSPALRKKMGDSGRLRISEFFSWSSKGLFIQELLAELDGQSSARGIS
ncbi:MAG TPA: glycosyltransferase [Geobacteraceae bacterium]